MAKSSRHHFLLIFSNNLYIFILLIFLEVMQAVSDEVIRMNTGKEMFEWTNILTKFNAREKSTERVIKHLKDCYSLNGWWAEKVLNKYLSS